MSFQDRTIIISVEGNIGSGKTLLLRELASNAAIQVVFEPEQMWRQLKKEYNLLAHFYDDRSRWTYSFQTVAFIARTQALMCAHVLTSDRVLVSERSVFSDRYCFAQASQQLGHMSETEWHAYHQWFDWLAPTYAIVPDGFIYLRSQPEQCLQKIKQSERIEERGVTKEYLERLHACHESWLLSNVFLGPAMTRRPILIVEAEQLQNRYLPATNKAVDDFIRAIECQKLSRMEHDVKHVHT